jgi:dipeptidyl aminopeptidase/acylaminoacyl peptidase
MTRIHSFTKVLLVFLVLSSFSQAFASPISKNDLFKGADTYSFKLSPSSKYVVKNYFRGKNYDVLEIIDLASGKKADAFRVKVKKYAFIRDYKWVDENTLYIEYRLKEHQERRIFLDLDYDIFHSTDDEIASSRRIESDVKIIDPLSHLDNQLLIQKKIGEQYKVYTASTEEVLRNEFNTKKRFAKHVDGSLGYDTGADGKIRFTATIEEKKLKIWYLENYQADWTELFEFGEFDFDFKPIEIIGNDTMLVITNKDTDKASLVKFNYKEKIFGEVLYQHDKYDLVSADVSQTDGTVNSVSYFESGHLKTEYFSKKNISLDEMVRKQFSGKQYYIHSRRGDSDIMIMFVFSSDDPGSYHWFNSKTNTFRDLGPAYSYLAKYNFSKTKVFSVKSENEVEIEAILTIPNYSNGVLLVSPHGGPVGVRNLDVFSRSNQFYASRGYSVLNVNFRGSSGYGKKFLTEGKGQFGKRIEQDITLAVNKVKQTYRFDKTCSLGSSYGGYSAVMLAAYHPEDYDCLIGAYGVYDLPLLFNTSNMQMSEERIKAISNTVGEYSDSLKDYSPVYFAEKIHAPVLLIAGRNDSISGFEQTNRMKYRLKQLNKDIEILAYDDTGHGHTSNYWNAHEHVVIDEFIRRKLELEPAKGASDELLGNEAMLIADAYAFDGKVKNNIEKAFSYYRKAANYNRPRAIYNLASYYQTGEIGEKNISKAVKLYKRASALGYKDASYRLGLFYKNGDLVERDFDKSYGFFKLSKEQEHEKASEQISHLSCLGIGEATEFDNCLKYIDKSLAEGKNSVLTTVADILFIGNKSTEEVNKLVKLMASHNYLEGLGESKFIVENFGSYKFSKRRGWYTHDDSDLSVEISGLTRIGATIRFKNKSFTAFPVATYRVTWTHPEFKPDENGRTSTKSETLHYNQFNNQVALIRNFYNKRERVDGEWRLTIESLSGVLLLDKTFHITFKK